LPNGIPSHDTNAASFCPHRSETVCARVSCNGFKESAKR
jgi:hypothetical protein